MSQLSTVSAQQKYGLVKKSGTSQAAPKQRLLRPSAFSDSLEDDDDEDNGNKTAQQDVRKASYDFYKRSQASSVDANAAAALSEDPNVFDYDGAYDSFSAQKEAKIAEKELQKMQDQPKARYINNLMTTAKVREKERERIYEKKLLKERIVEDEQFGEQPKFLTTAYKQKLLENQQWEYEDKLAEELEKRHDVRKVGMQGFYANLLTKNVSVGGDVSNAISAYTAGSDRQSGVVSTTDHQQPLAAPSAAEEANQANQKLPEDHRANVFNREHTPLEASNHTVEREQRPNSIEKKEPGTLPSSKADETTEPATQKAKQEQLDAARERYLARKRNASNMLEN